MIVPRLIMPAITSRALIVAAPLALIAIAAGLGMFAVGCEPDDALFRPVDQVAEDARTDSVGLIDGSGDTAPDAFAAQASHATMFAALLVSFAQDVRLKLDSRHAK